MRLICPNCGAQYEVNDNIIPDAGRDVQCSNCGNTWFQRSARMDAELSAELDEPYDSDTDDDWHAAAPGPDEPSSVASPREEQQPDFTQAASADDEYEVEEDIDYSSHAIDREKTRRELDASVVGVLREEAEYEARARGTETLETQTDLGLEDTDEAAGTRSSAVRERMARLRGIEPDEPASEPATRRELLPDIEEINSTLRATSERKGADAAADAPLAEIPVKRNRGFRLGFGLVLVATTAAVGLYIFAPEIVQRAPQTETLMASYVDQVNSLRLWLDAALERAIHAMSPA